jgi:hypothetical protein
MRRSERQNHSSSVPEASSRAPSLSPIDAPSLPRVTLPSDLSGSLKSLDDAQLQRLLEAVTVEIDRRNQGPPKNETAKAAATGTSSQSQSVTFRDKKTRGIDEFPEGTAKSYSGVVPGGGQAGGHCPHVSNIPVLRKSHSKRDRKAKTIG